MPLDPQQCYRALRSRDARFDGRFFIGVRTTRIYCRPICTVRPPLARNCRYFPSAAAAERDGFRPCLRCRPELAPGFAAVDAKRRLAQAAARLITDGALSDGKLADLAKTLSVTDRHLRRVFHEELGVAPVEFAQTQRLLLAKRLLTDTEMSVLAVALASGFGSLRRFNALFRARYRMKPTDLRRGRPRGKPLDRLSFDLAYRPPYDWPAMLAFLGARAIAGVEHIAAGRYRRSLRVGDRTGWIEVAPAPRRAALRVTVSDSFAPCLPRLLSRVRALFDLSCDPHEIAEALGPLARARPGLRVPGAVDGFEIAVRAILGQQITVRAASTIAGRLVRALGDPFEGPGLERLFPGPERIARCSQDEIARHGIIGTRARAIISLARALVDGELSLDSSAEVGATLAGLEALPGVGPWTAQYIAMRALAWPDAFPHPDVVVRKALAPATPRATIAIAEAWRPFRAYAVLHLWKSQETSP